MDSFLTNLGSSFNWR